MNNNIMKNDKKETPYNIGGMNPVLFSVIFILLIVLFSISGYVVGLSNIDDTQNLKMDVEVKTDSALMEVIRGQLKIEMEMLKVINEKTNQRTPIIYNIIKQKPDNCASKVVNSFNHNIVGADSISK